MDANRLFRKFLIIPLLKPQHLQEAYDNILQLESKKYDIFDEFIKYYGNQWIKKLKIINF